MSSMWGRISAFTAMLGIVLIMKAILGFRNHKKVLDKTKGFTKKEMLKHMNSHITRNIYYVITGMIFILVASIILVVLRK